jgi:hypothetical protein
MAYAVWTEYTEAATLVISFSLVQGISVMPIPAVTGPKLYFNFTGHTSGR